MNQSILFLTALFFISLSAQAANTPCSGKKGGISHCQGTTFACNDGSFSRSKKNCSVEFGGNITPQADPEQPDTAPVADVPQQADPVRADEPSESAVQSGTVKMNGNIIEISYPGFTVWLDCAKRGAVKFRYKTQHDTGNAKRFSRFFLDPNIAPECQQTSSDAYGHDYDRGHQVPANHLDSSEVAIKATNSMPNILPQAKNMNRGAWLLTEEIIECYRDAEELLVIGGVIWGDNPADDYFVKSHGVKTPDAYWKVIVRGNGQDQRAIAWVVPNTPEATKKNLDRYLVTSDEIEKLTGERIPVADEAKHQKPAVSWKIPKGCNKS